MKIFKFLKPALSVFLFAVLFLNSGSLKAQCSGLQNNLGCQIGYKVEIYTPDPMTGVCNILCHSFSGGLGVFSTIPFPCGPCITVCNVVVTITQMNGVPIPPTSADFSTLPPGVSIPTPPGPCKPQPGSPNPRLLFSGGLFRIVP